MDIVCLYCAYSTCNVGICACEVRTTRVRDEGHRSRIGPALGLAILLLCAALAVSIYQPAYPLASGTKTHKSGGAVLDASNMDYGYIMIKKPSGKKLKVRVTGTNEYTYDLRSDGEYDVYPLQDGSGKYRVAVFEQVKGTSYSQILSESIRAELVHEYAAFLVSNRYSRYVEEGTAVLLAQEICADLETDREKAEAVYAYIASNYTYDYHKAATVKSGYVPDLEDTIETRTGICFDHASLMCAMLRSQGVPTKLVFGYADNFYHAWNEILIDEEWVHRDSTAAIAGFDIAKYTEEAVY
jgi:hypothetical protein